MKMNAIHALCALPFLISACTDSTARLDLERISDRQGGATIRVDLDHDQRFVIPSNAVAGDRVGEKSHNPNWRVVDRIEYSISSDPDSCFAIDAQGRIFVTDGSRLNPGTTTLIVRLKDDTYWDESKCEIEIVDASSCAFVDPENSQLNPTGTRENPFPSISDALSSAKKHILLKRGSVEERISAITLQNTTELLVGAYGDGNRPIIKYVGDNTKQKIFSINRSDKCEIRDIHTQGREVATVGFITGYAENTIFDNCISEGCHYGFRIMFESHNTKVLNSRIHTIQADGMWVQNAQNVEVGYCDVYDVAQNGNVDGDCIQFSNKGTSYNNTGWYIHHNKLDRSGTVGKFCLILGGNAGDVEKGTIAYNWMIGNPDAEGTNSSGSLGITNLYMSPVDEATIEGNLFQNASNYGLFISSDTSRLYIKNNIFLKSGDYAISGPNSATNITMWNNLVYECAYKAKGPMIHFHGAVVDLKNNILVNDWGGKAYTYGTVDEDNNLFSEGGLESYGEHSFVAEPLFVDAENLNFRLEESSPAIDGGMILDEGGVDHEGKARFSGTSVDIGPFESVL